MRPDTATFCLLHGAWHDSSCWHEVVAEDEAFEPAWIRFVARELLAVEPIELPGG